MDARFVLFETVIGGNIEGLRCAAVINLNRIAANYNLCKRKAKKIIAVVKADAYGHGAREVSRRLQDEGCVSFAVSNIDEAEELKLCGIKGEIIILGYVAVGDFPLLKAIGATPLVYDERSYRLAEKEGISAYLKIDTGMGRLGFAPDDNKLWEIVANKNFGIKGIMTHYSVADSLRAEDVLYTREQTRRFYEVSERIKNSGREVSAYGCNSAASAVCGDLFDGARIGISLYGVNPSSDVVIEGLQPVMTFNAVVSSVKTVKANDYISYGRTFAADKEMKVAVIAAGYADGYRRGVGNAAYVFLDGKKVPVIGNVTMDQIIVCADGIDCAVGDVVELFGDNIPVAKVAEWADTIPYEILTGISKRVPRIYV